MSGCQPLVSRGHCDGQIGYSCSVFLLDRTSNASVYCCVGDLCSKWIVVKKVSLRTFYSSTQGVGPSTWFELVITPKNMKVWQFCLVSEKKGLIWLQRWHFVNPRPLMFWHGSCSVYPNSIFPPSLAELPLKHFWVPVGCFPSSRVYGWIGWSLF